MGLIIDGATVGVNTTESEASFSIASALASAINGEPVLSAAGVTAVAASNSVTATAGGISE